MTAPLVIRDLHVAHDARAILQGVDLDVAPGEICTLMGLSGAGKSTLLRAVAALQGFSRGSIVVGDATLRPGDVPRESALRALRRQVGMVFQAHSLFEHLSALDNVTLALLHVHRWDRARAEATAMALLESLGVADRAHARPKALSGGQAQRVAIARALAPGPTLLLLDEPTSALDPARRAALGASLRQLADAGRALLVSTHDIDFAQAFADRVVVLSEGRIVEQGAPNDVLLAPSHRATRELLRG